MRFEYGMGSTGKTIQASGRFIKVDRQKIDPLGSGSFVSIAYYETPDCEIVGIVF